MNAMEHGNEYRADRPVVDPRGRDAADERCASGSPTGRRGPIPEPRRPTSRRSSRAPEAPRLGLFLIENMVDESA